MMNRRYFMVMFGAAVGAASMSFAETFADQVVRQLVAQGFANIEVEATLLGRLRIKGRNATGLREIILNPKTGEILRDVWLDAFGNPIRAQLQPAAAGEVAKGPDNSGPGSDSDDAEDAADVADDARDDAEDARDDADDARDEDADEDGDEDGDRDKDDNDRERDND